MQTESIQLIPLSVIVPGDNDRIFFEQQALVELAASMADVGLAEPIIIRPVFMFNCQHALITEPKEFLPLWNYLINLQLKSSVIPPVYLTGKEVSITSKRTTDLEVPLPRLSQIMERTLPDSYNLNGKSELSIRNENSSIAAPTITCGTGPSMQQKNSNSFLLPVCPICGLSMIELEKLLSMFKNIYLPSPDTNGLPMKIDTSKNTGENKMLTLPQSSIGPNQASSTDVEDLTSISHLVGLIPFGQNQIQSFLEPTSILLTVNSPNSLAKPKEQSDRNEIDWDYVNVRALLQVVAGERRWRASGVYTQKVESGEWPESPKCKPGHIQAIVRELNDEAAAGVMLAENIHRKDINPMEECRAYLSRMERFGWSQERVAKEAKTNPTRVRNRIRLGLLADEIQELIAKGHFDLGWAEELVPLDHNRQRMVVAWIRDQKSYKPTRGQVTAQVSILLEQQSQEAMFDLNALFAPVAVEVAQDDKRVSDMLPDLGIPGLRLRTGKIGTVIDDYIALLIEQNRPLEARVVIHLWRHLMKSNFAQVYPWDSKALPLLERLR